MNCKELFALCACVCVCVRVACSNLWHVARGWRLNICHQQQIAAQLQLQIIRRILMAKCNLQLQQQQQQQEYAVVLPPRTRASSAAFVHSEEKVATQICAANEKEKIICLLSFSVACTGKLK